jgi:hypothetical protein
MSDIDFFEFAFENIWLVVMSILAATLALYLSVRRTSPAGYLDPIHFYWTFTFGSAYGVVLALFISSKIDSYLVIMMASYGLLLVITFVYFSGAVLWLHRLSKLLLVPKANGKFEFWIIFTAYIVLAVFLILNTGLGSSAEFNRFEQNRGFGAFVRVADAFRLFIISYLFLWLTRRWKSGSRFNLGTMLLAVLFVIIVTVSSLLNGAKFAILESFYVSIVVLTVANIRFKLSFIKLSIIGAVVLTFCLYILSVNLQNSGVDTSSNGQYLKDSPLIIERLVLRVLANADKYYLALPNNVIERLQTDSLGLQLLSPLVGVTRLSEWVGHPVNDFTVGRQSLLYWYPDFAIAGGPTSHFDLFSYKYLGYIPGAVFVCLLGYLLAAISSLLTQSGSDYQAAISATFWLRALPILLEPATGLAYIIDIFVLFFLIKLLGALIRAAIYGSSRSVLGGTK